MSRVDAGDRSRGLRFPFLFPFLRLAPFGRPFVPARLLVASPVTVRGCATLRKVVEFPFSEMAAVAAKNEITALHVY